MMNYMANHKRILIAAASKTGTALQCAALLAGCLPDGLAEICDLTRNRPSPADYDLAVVGGSVRMGALHKAARQYLRSYRSLLQNMPAAYFICNCFVEQKETILKNNFPDALLQTAVCADSFGGVMDLSVQKGMDRLIAGMAARTLDSNAAAGIRKDSIDAFADALMRAL